MYNVFFSIIGSFEGSSAALKKQLYLQRKKPRFKINRRFTEKIQFSCNNETCTGFYIGYCTGVIIKTIKEPPRNKEPIGESENLNRKFITEYDTPVYNLFYSLSDSQFLNLM